MEGACLERTWTDICNCRQRFNIDLKSAEVKPNAFMVIQREYYATSFGVYEMSGAPHFVVEKVNF